MPRDAADTRTKILDAAQGIVLKRGFAATSVDAIQEAAGISRGTFFYHFGSKDDLARELIGRYATADHAMVEKLKARAEKLATDPLQRLLVFLALHEELFEEAAAGEVGCLFASYTYEAGLFDAETHALIEGSVEHWRRVVSAWLLAAAERHEPPRPVDADLWADLTYGVLQGAFILSRVRRDSGLMARHVHELRRMVELLFQPAPASEAVGP